MKSNGSPQTLASSSKRNVRISPEKQCLYRLSGGDQCRAPRRKGKEFCLYHDPGFHNVRIEAQAAAERASTRMRPDSAEGLQNLLLNTAEALVRGEISPAVASSVGYLAQVMSANLRALAQERSSFFNNAKAADKAQFDDASARLSGLEFALQQARGVPFATLVELESAAAAKAAAEKAAAAPADPPPAQPAPPAAPPAEA